MSISQRQLNSTVACGGAVPPLAPGGTTSAACLIDAGKDDVVLDRTTRALDLLRRVTALKRNILDIDQRKPQCLARVFWSL